MFRRVTLGFGVWGALAIATLAGVDVANAQLSFVTPTLNEPPAVEPFAADAVNDVVRRGLDLERDRRWGEALSVYEDGLRSYPAHPELERRLAETRTHYELSRRYNDASFRRAVATVSEREAVDLYGEVLLKIQSHYVDEPDWAQLLRHSLLAFQTALSDPLFREHAAPQQPAARFDRLARDLPEWLRSRPPVTSRHEARDQALYVARIARDQLGIAPQTTVLEYTCAATTGLDAYSAFLTADQLNEVYSQIEGNFVGLGIELKADDGALLIVKTIPGSPAAQAGIRSGDRIVGVDGRPTKELSTEQAANLLQGPEGSMVDVTVATPGYNPRVLRVRRQQVEVPSIEGARIVEPGIGYLKLTSFQKTTSRDLDEALWSLERQGMKALIIDLSGNPGGLLATSVEVVDKFVSSGVIVSTRGRSPREDYTYTAHPAGTWSVPLVVMIDGDSASASEIFAGAIRDHRRGTIVGTRSYGKGSVQGIFPLNTAQSGLRLTTSKFLSPDDRPYSGVGVEPDVVVQEVARPTDDGSAIDDHRDPVFEAAVNAARNNLAKR